MKRYKFLQIVGIVESRSSLLKTNKDTLIVIRSFYADTKNLIGRFH